MSTLQHPCDCGSPFVGLMHQYSTMTGCPIYYYECSSCGQQSSPCESAVEAVACWNIKVNGELGISVKLKRNLYVEEVLRCADTESRP